MRLNIRNMVCERCVMAVRQILAEMGEPQAEIALGWAKIPTEPTRQWLDDFDKRLRQIGFELIEDPEAALVEQIKIAVQEHARKDGGCNLNLSACLEEHLHQDYRRLSRIFSAREGRTIENYMVAQRIERVKELISEGVHTMTEIAYRTGFSSVAHMSRLFKQSTGMTPTQYLDVLDRSPIDKI